MLSLRQSLISIGELQNAPFQLRASFGNRSPSSLKMAILGMTDPQVAGWRCVGRIWHWESSKFSEEAQGITTDGTSWFLSSNNTKSVVKLTGKEKLQVVPSADVPTNSHFGAPGYYDGWVYVPLQNPHGVWKFAADLSLQAWLPVQEVDLPDNDMFPWCAVYPVNGLLYTSNFGDPFYLRAYDRDTLVRHPDSDILIDRARSPIRVNKIQGGLFTPMGRAILVSGEQNTEYNNIFCFSAFNGYCFGASSLGDYGTAWSEVESVAYLPLTVRDVVAPIHVLELDNDLSNKDDIYLWSFSVPIPELL